MPQPIPFNFNDNLVRVVMHGPDPWFVGKDICRVLDIAKHHQALDRLDCDERGTCAVGTPSGDQEMIIISEPGAFRLIFTSRKPQTEVFKRWLAHEVLPALRRDGFYACDDRRPRSDTEQALDGEPIATLNVKLAMIREARACFGPDRARTLWASLGLPAVPLVGPVEVSRADEAALSCLRHLLQRQISTGMLDEHDQPERITISYLLLEALDGNEAARADLSDWGIRVFEAPSGRATFWIANRAQKLTSAFEGTIWSGRWRHSLIRLPGAKSTGNYRVGMGSSRGVMLPEALLDAPACAAHV